MAEKYKWPFCYPFREPIADEQKNITLLCNIDKTPPKVTKKRACSSWRWELVQNSPILTRLVFFEQLHQASRSPLKP